MNTPSCDYDVCVFGAGPAGTAAAIGLAEQGLRVAVLDRAVAEKPWGGESFTGVIRQPLETLGLWDWFVAAGHVPGYERRVSWGRDNAPQSSIFSQYGNLWHVDRARFDADLRAAIVARGISVVTYGSLSVPRYDGRRWLAGVDTEPGLACRFIVDATGRARAIARRLGIRPVVHDRLIALTKRVPRHSDPAFGHTMQIETTALGWWYAAPVPLGHVLAFFTDTDLAPRDDAGGFRPAVANSSFVPVDPSAGWLPVGDACAAHDPLCGWGVHRAMTNGLLAAAAITAHLRHGVTAELEAYARHCAEQFAQYLVGLKRNYALEHRWSGSPFWDRRAAGQQTAS